MQVKIAGNCALVAGFATKDAEFKTIGEKNTPLTSFSLAVGNTKEEGAYANCKAFGKKLSAYARGIKKGDSVCAIGIIETREFNGKTYKDLNCQWINYIGETAAASSTYLPLGEQLAHTGFIEEPYPEEDDLPFNIF